MANTFPEWIKQLERDNLHVPMPSITRGLAHEVTFTPEGDFSGDTFTMQLRSAPDAGTTLATFVCTPQAFNGTGTPIVIALAADSQGLITDDVDGIGVVDLPYDLICNPAAGEPYRFMAGYQPVSGLVTS